MKDIKIRTGELRDIDAVHDLVVELAVYEKEPDAVTAKKADYRQHFQEGAFEFIVAEVDHVIGGMAIFYPTYSTWKGKMMYLEDFVVSQSYRRLGIGQMLFDQFLAIAKDRGCVLTKWEVLDWNTPALQFYEKIGATIEKHWWDGKLYL